MDTSISKLKISDPKVLVGLAMLLVFMGGMVMDPLAGFICFVLSGILSLIGVLKGTWRIRFFTIFLLIIILILAISKFPEGIHHLGVYKSKAVNQEKYPRSETEWDTIHLFH